MICVIERGTIASIGKFPEAKRLVLEMAAYRNRKNPGAKAQVMTNLSGQNQELRLMTFADSLAAWEETDHALGEDPEYLALLAKIFELVVPGSVHTDVHRVVE